MADTTLRPDFGYEDCRFPPLPSFRSSLTEVQAFTHISLHARPANLFEDPPGDPSPDYEKLEHLGDSVLQLHVTDLIRKIYPAIREGSASSIRAMIVGNDNLATISLKYKLPDRLRAHSSQIDRLRLQSKIQADIFEAVVGGLYIERGFDGLTKWMEQLFRPYIVTSYNLQREANTALALRSPSGPISIASNANSTMQYTALFNQHFQTESRNYIHRKIKSGNDTLWYVTLQVNGRLYGSGAGPTLKAARSEAARQGLLSLGLIH